MSRPKNPPLVSGAQFLAIVVLTLSILLIVDLGRRATAGYHVTQAEKRLRQEIDAALERQKELRARRDHVASDSYRRQAPDHGHATDAATPGAASGTG
jgi:hypothetical protein